MPIAAFKVQAADCRLPAVMLRTLTSELDARKSWSRSCATLSSAVLSQC